MVSVHIAILVCMVIQLQLAKTEDCPTAWFGRKCLAHCNCKDKTDCPTCQQGGCGNAYFGVNCQYRDLMQEQSTKMMAPMGKRHREYEDIGQVRTAPLEIYFGYANYFTWMEICFSDNDSKEISSFYLSFKKHSSNRTKEETVLDCPSLSKLYLSNDDCLVLRCSPYKQATRLFVFWAGVRYFKSIHVSGGVNIALKERILIGKKNGSSAQYPQNLVDDSLTTQVKTYRTNKSKPPLFVISLRKPAWIQRIVVVSVHKNLDELAVNVSVDRSDSSTTVISYLGYNRAFACHFFAFVAPIHRKARRVTISGADPSNRFWLTLSEVQIFSECTSFNYGPTCEDICSIGCADLTCHVNGDCFACLKEMKGRLCLEFHNSSFDETSYDDPGEENGHKENHHRKSEDLFYGSDFAFALLFGAIILVVVVMSCLYIVCNIAFGREVVLLNQSPSKTQSRYTRSSLASSYKRKSLATTNVSSSSEKVQATTQDSSSDSNSIE